jgi:hypothetical protein
MKPWLYLRFTDGMFFSICGGHGRRNADGSHYRPDTCGVELRRVFNEAYRSIDEGMPVTVELPNCWNHWPAVSEAVMKMTSRQLAATVVGPVLTRAVIDNSIFDVLDALYDSQAPKAWIAQGNDRPTIEAVGMAMIEAPRPDAWDAMDDLESTVTTWMQGRKSLLVTTVGLPSRCLQWRLWKGVGVSIDLGSVCDALAGRVTRSYMRKLRRSKTIPRRFKQWKEKHNE